jgi:Fe-Mn family superoxide dismutase
MGGFYTHKTAVMRHVSVLVVCRRTFVHFLREFAVQSELGASCARRLGVVLQSGAPKSKLFKEIRPMAYQLPPLPYAFNALEPHIDAKTMEIHHGKHHQAYITNANNALADLPDLAALSVEDLLKNIGKVPEAKKQALINNAGGHANHSLFWQIMGPGKGGEPKGALADDIKATFGDFAAFKEKFTQGGVTRFGSGWSWLVVDSGKKLQLYATLNQDSPIMKGDTPILGCDVWEHAYYLNYQNRRPDYIAAWWNVVNWDKVSELYAAAKK